MLYPAKPPRQPLPQSRFWCGRHQFGNGRPKVLHRRYFKARQRAALPHAFRGFRSPFRHFFITQGPHSCHLAAYDFLPLFIVHLSPLCCITFHSSGTASQPLNSNVREHVRAPYCWQIDYSRVEGYNARSCPASRLSTSFRIEGSGMRAAHQKRVLFLVLGVRSYGISCSLPVLQPYAQADGYAAA